MDDMPVFQIRCAAKARLVNWRRGLSRASRIVLCLLGEASEWEQSVVVQPSAARDQLPPLSRGCG
jgi:hypothetical protein